MFLSFTGHFRILPAISYAAKKLNAAKNSGMTWLGLLLEPQFSNNFLKPMCLLDIDYIVIPGHCKFTDDQYFACLEHYFFIKNIYGTLAMSLVC